MNCPCGGGELEPVNADAKACLTCGAIITGREIRLEKLTDEQAQERLRSPLKKLSKDSIARTRAERGLDPL